MMPSTAEIRQFLMEAFSDEELNAFCFDYFADVYNGFTAGQTKGQRVQALIEYCQRRGLFPNLAAALQRARPEQYTQYFPAEVGGGVANVMPDRPVAESGGEVTSPSGTLPKPPPEKAPALDPDPTASQPGNAPKSAKSRRQIEYVAIAGLIIAACACLAAWLVVPEFRQILGWNTPTPTPTAILTSMPSHTSTPTLTPTITPTSTPTATSVASLASPVQIGTPVPLPTEVISTTNAQHLQQLAQWGKGKPERIMYSPDGKYLAVQTSRGIYLYDAQTRQELRFIERPWIYYSSAFVPQSDKLMVSQDETFYLFPLSEDGVPEKVQADYWISSVAASPDGRWLAAGQYGGDYGMKLQIWDWKKSFIPVFTQLYITSVLSLAFSPDSQTLAAGLEDGNISLISQKGQWAEQRVLAGHIDKAQSLAFSPKGTWLASGGDNGTFEIWNWRPLTGTIVYSETHDGHIKGLVFGPDDTEDWLTVALSGGENKVRVVPTTGEALQPPPFEQLVYPAGVIDVAYAPDGNTLGVVTYDAQIELIQAKNGQRLDSLSGFTPGYVVDLAFTSDDHKLWSAMLDDVGIRQWSMTTGNPTLVLTGNLGLGRFAVSPNTRYAAAPIWDHYIRVWNIASPAKHQDWNLAPDHNPRRVAFSTQGLMAVGDDRGLVWVWKMPNDTLLFTLTQTSAITLVNTVEFSPNGDLLAIGAEDGTARIWRVADRSLASELPIFTEAVNDLTFSPDGTLLAVSTADGKIRIMRLTGNKILQELDNQGVQAESVAFAPGGDLLAVTLSDGDTEIWSVRTGELLITLDDHTAYARGLAFSKDGRLLATGADDATISIWGIPPH
jgi:WD40 repeat protein